MLASKASGLENLELANQERLPKSGYRPSRVSKEPNTVDAGLRALLGPPSKVGSSTRWHALLYALARAAGRAMFLIRASCSPDASQQSIWASLGGWAEGCITAIRGVDSSCRCRYSLGRDQNPDSGIVSCKSFMLSRC